MRSYNKKALCLKQVIQKHLDDAGRRLAAFKQFLIGKRPEETNADVLARFKGHGKGYQSRINTVLRELMLRSGGRG